MKKVKTKRWDPAEQLDSDAKIVGYLEAALEDGDSALVTAALGDIARAKGMTKIAEAAGLGRESLYKSLSPKGNPELSTVLRVVTALGLRLRAAPAKHPRRKKGAAKIFVVLLACALAQGLSAQSPSPIDWPDLHRYRAANAELTPPAPGENRVVFMGNSITEYWAKSFAQLFPGKPYIGRGISGQTTPQMLLRFRQDVVYLKPKVVVILGGTNDIAGNTGPSSLDMIEDNLASMTEIAQANGIRVVLASVLPVFDYPWRKGLEPAPKILALNDWIKKYAARVGAVYVDFHTPMQDERHGMKPALANDGVHPTAAGYALMAPIVEQAIADALRP